LQIRFDPIRFDPIRFDPIRLGRSDSTHQAVDPTRFGRPDEGADAAGDLIRSDSRSDLILVALRLRHKPRFTLIHPIRSDSTDLTATLTLQMIRFDLIRFDLIRLRIRSDPSRFET